MSTITTVPFHGHSLITIKDGGVIRVAMKPITDAIGLQWEAQHKRIQRHPVLSTCMSMIDMQLPDDAQRRKIVTLPLEMLNGWLFGVDVNRVKPEIRDTLLTYQRECFHVLFSYWHQGEAINPRINLTPEHQHELRKAIARRVQTMPKGIHRIAYARLYSHLHERFSVAKYDQIDDSRYTEALAAVETCQMEGEWIEAQPERSMPDIHFTVARWLEENPWMIRYNDPQHHPANTLNITAKMLCEMDHRSPTQHLLKELEQAGYNVDACRIEVSALRHHLNELRAYIRDISRGMDNLMGNGVRFRHQ